ncbi:MAG: hypothetical protein IJ638_03095 [Alphaproteobacteria bacterium]|nr:hypothetical protein [Alphaproteobacteria bacterium]
MSKKVKKVVDEHENMEPVFSQRRNNVIMILFIAFAIFVVAYISIGIVKRERERQRIDAIVSSIQNEIYLKQCHLDKMYCCGYKDKDACEKWAKANCSEEDGSLEINCNVKF